MKKRIASVLRAWANGLDPAKPTPTIEYHQWIQALDYERLSQALSRAARRTPPGGPQGTGAGL